MSMQPLPPSCVSFVAQPWFPVRATRLPVLIAYRLVSNQGGESEGVLDLPSWRFSRRLLLLEIRRI